MIILLVNILYFQIFFSFIKSTAIEKQSQILILRIRDNHFRGPLGICISCDVIIKVLLGLILDYLLFLFNQIQVLWMSLILLVIWLKYGASYIILIIKRCCLDLAKAFCKQFSSLKLVVIVILTLLGIYRFFINRINLILLILCKN